VKRKKALEVLAENRQALGQESITVLVKSFQGQELHGKRKTKPRFLTFW
jgi:hypothetical protein